jgi:hypothetical protein
MNDCSGKQKARLPELTVRLVKLPVSNFWLAGRLFQVFPLVHGDEGVPVFIRIDRHTLRALLAQPKVFATAELTLAKPCSAEKCRLP